MERYKTSHGAHFNGSHKLLFLPYLSAQHFPHNIMRSNEKRKKVPRKKGDADDVVGGIGGRQAAARSYKFISQ